MKRFILFTLGVLMLLSIASPGNAGSVGGPTYRLQWADAFFENASLTLPKTLTEDSLSVTPNINMATVQRLRLTFSLNGEEKDRLPVNAVEIRLPASIFTDAKGNAAESKVVVPLPRDTSFNYRIDPDTQEIVIYNFESISEALLFTLEIDYHVLPSNVRLPSLPGEPIKPHTKDITADVKVVSGGQTIIDNSTNTIHLSYKTDSRLNSTSKFVPSTGGSYPTWPVSWGIAPPGDDPTGYFYIRWNISIGTPSTNTQPFSVKITDVPGASEGGEVVGWMLNDYTIIQANYADGMDNNLQEFHEATKQARYYATPNTYQSSTTISLLMRYPRDLQVDPKNPLRKYKEINNQVTAELIGDYGASDIKTAKAATYTYAELQWSAPDGNLFFHKLSLPASAGIINRLENAWLAGSTEPMNLSNSYSDFSVSGTHQQYKRTQDENGVPYTKEWTAVTTDINFFFDTTSPAAPAYYRLQAGDYLISSITLSRPSERIYAEPDAFGFAPIIDQSPDKFGTTVVQYSTVLNPTEDDWKPLGSVTMNPSRTWTFTPVNGAATTTNANTANFSVLDLVPGQDVLGLRLLQHTKSAQVTHALGIKIEVILPST